MISNSRTMMTIMVIISQTGNPAVLEGGVCVVAIPEGVTDFVLEAATGVEIDVMLKISDNTKTVFRP